MTTVADQIERLQLGNVHVPDIAPQSNIVDTTDTGTSYLYAQKETCSDQFWYEDNLQPCLLNRFTWPIVSSFDAMLTSRV